MNRSPLFAPGLFLSVLAVLVAGCGGNASSGPPRHSAKIVARGITGCPKRTVPAGTLKYSDWEFPDTLNPYQTTAASSFETINGLLEGLFLYNSQAQVVPQLAAVVPTVANGGIKNGGKTIVVRLKKGLHWSDGSAITSQDVVFGWKVGMDPVTGPYCTGSCDQIARIDTPDAYTAIIRMKRVFASAVPTAMPQVWPHNWKGAWTNNPHAAAVKLAQDTTFNFEGASFPTNGPYQVVNFVKDDRIQLRPMRQYTGMNCGAAVKNLIFSFYSSKQGMMAAAASGGTDLTQDYTTADLKDLNKNAGAQYTVSSTPGFIFEHFEFNVDKTYNGKPNPLANATVRQALALALDKLGLIESALAVDRATAQKIIAWTPWVNTPQLVQPFANRAVTGQWDSIARAYVMPGTPRAIADAKRLLARTPYRAGFTTSISTTTANPTRQAELEVAANNWRKLGVKVVPNLVPATTFFSGWAQGGPLNHGKFQVALFTFSGSPDPDTFKYELQSKYIDRTAKVHASINENYAGIRDPVLDAAFNRASATLNRATREREYNTIQARLNQRSYWISLYFRPQIATRGQNLLGFSNNPTSLGPTWNMYAWKTRQVS